MDELVAAVQMAKRRAAAGQVVSNRPPYGLIITGTVGTSPASST
jgi:hypothetical protein